ncbi:DUF2914 domain-containing protein [bacterium]|nr:DUF2914 domain-containing protein [bacterium]
MKSVSTYVKKTTRWYTRYQNVISPVSFLLGFVWDAFSSKRIDAMDQNYLLMGYLLIAGILLLLLHAVKAEKIKTGFWVTYQKLLPLGFHFCLGNLYSNHVYFYFQSAAGFKSLVFIAGLMVLLLANEFYKERIHQFYLQFVMFFLAAFSFFIFFVPLFTRELGYRSFLIGGCISLVFTMMLIFAVALIARARYRKLLIKSAGLMIVIYGVMNIFYFARWIPPVPLALRHAGIYHTMKKKDQRYELQYEKAEAWEFWRTSGDVYHWQPGDTVICFAAIFAPTEIHTTIHYQWEQYLEDRNAWVMQDHQSHTLQGGRDAGYRGYSRKGVISPGAWRVEITTEEGLLMGSLNFRVEQVTKEFERKLETIEW